MQPMMLMEMNDEAACEACDGDTDVALGAWTCRSRWRACSGRCWSSASPSPRGARELRRMQGTGDARLTVESRDPVGCVRSARGRLRGPCPGPGRGEVSVTDVELVMLERAARRGAVGFVGFRWMSTERRTGGTRADKARRLHAAVGFPLWLSSVSHWLASQPWLGR